MSQERSFDHLVGSRCYSCSDFLADHTTRHRGLMLHRTIVRVYLQRCLMTFASCFSLYGRRFVILREARRRCKNDCRREGYRSPNGTKSYHLFPPCPKAPLSVMIARSKQVARMSAATAGCGGAFSSPARHYAHADHGLAGPLAVISSICADCLTNRTSIGPSRIGWVTGNQSATPTTSIFHPVEHKNALT
jgi:hypothetical protein